MTYDQNAALASAPFPLRGEDPGSDKMSYRAFWSRYLSAHADPRTRALHYLGTLLAMAFLAAGALFDWRLFLLAPLCGYSFAWFGHFVIERNRPQSFGHPLWSLFSDFRMLALFLSFRLGKELRRQDIGEER